MIPECPKCSAPMAQRTPKIGILKGIVFYGCVNWPHCKGKRSTTELEEKLLELDFSAKQLVKIIEECPSVEVKHMTRNELFKIAEEERGKKSDW